MYMETSNIILIIILILFIITIAGHIVVVNTNPVQTTTTTSTVVVRKPNQPVKVVGGCAGTQYGCCPNGVTAKANYAGSNCY